MREVLRELGLVVDWVEEVVREVGSVGMEEEDMGMMMGVVDWGCEW